MVHPVGVSIDGTQSEVVTFNQVVRHRARTNQATPYNRSPKMLGCPQKLGICLRVGTVPPKKPNSAIRKIAKIRLASGRDVRAVIPGSGIDLVEHNTVLLRAGRARDIPGVHYKLIRNKHDLGPPFAFPRQQRRSKFGVANWVYLVKTPTGKPHAVVCALRSRRHLFQREHGLTPTWEKGRFKVQTARLREFDKD